MQNFAECIAVKGKFCGRKLCKKLRGQVIERPLISSDSDPSAISASDLRTFVLLFGKEIVD